MTDIKLRLDDISESNDDALELFYSGIKSAETRRTMEQNLRRFLVDVCEDILNGSFSERAKQFVILARKDQERATQIILAYTRLLKSKTILPKTDKLYLNPATIPNKIKPLKKLLDMNGVGLGWKRIYSTYPEEDNTHRGRGYTRDEISTLLEHAESLATEFFILASCSGGVRIGAWHNMKWECVFPVYRQQDHYTIENSDDAQIVCAAMVVYKSTPDEYIALISKEAWQKLQTYKTEWKRKTGHNPRPSDPILLEKLANPIPMTVNAIRNRMFRLIRKAGLRDKLTDGNRRHEVPATHGFRRFWDKAMMEAARKSDKLSALVKKERLLGHDGLVKTDKNYYWTDVLDLVPDYLIAMPELTINDSERLRQELESQKIKTDRLGQLNYEKDVAILRIEELEAKVNRMKRYGGL